MDLFISLSAYLLVCSISYIIIKKQYVRYDFRGGYQVHRNKKLSNVSLVVISALFTLYNILITTMRGFLSGDRLNYSEEFLGWKKTDSSGLQCIFNVVEALGGNIYWVFYLTTFVCVLITLIAYRKSKILDYRLFAILFVSEWLFFTITALKQCYVNAIAALFFVYLFEELKGQKTKNDIMCIALSLIAIWFHSTGAVLFLIYLVVKVYRIKPKSGKVLLGAIVVSFAFFEPILMLIGNVVSGIIPILAQKINQYLAEGYRAGDGSVLTIIKYIPFYYVALLGLLYRERMKNVIKNYDSYAIVAMIAAELLLFSAKIYWFLRFAGVFYVSVFWLFWLINQNIQSSQNRLINKAIVIGSEAFFFFRWFVLCYINFQGF